jgi:hypothetical protein
VTEPSKETVVPVGKEPVEDPVPLGKLGARMQRKNACRLY